MEFVLIVGLVLLVALSGHGHPHHVPLLLPGWGIPPIAPPAAWHGLLALPWLLLGALGLLMAAIVAALPFLLLAGLGLFLLRGLVRAPRQVERTAWAPRPGGQLSPAGSVPVAAPAASARGIHVVNALCFALVEQPAMQKPR